MKFQVTAIEFDFTEDDSDYDVIDSETQDEIYEWVMHYMWEVEDEEDLVDMISDNTGWCIKSISYESVTD